MRKSILIPSCSSWVEFQMTLAGRLTNLLFNKILDKKSFDKIRNISTFIVIFTKHTLSEQLEAAVVNLGYNS